MKPPNTVPAELKPATKDAILGITGAITVPIPNIAVVVEPNISVTFVNASIKLVNALIPTLTAEEFIIVDQKVWVVAFNLPILPSTESIYLAWTSNIVPLDFKAIVDNSVLFAIVFINDMNTARCLLPASDSAIQLCSASDIVDHLPDNSLNTSPNGLRLPSVFTTSILYLANAVAPLFNSAVVIPNSSDKSFIEYVRAIIIFIPFESSAPLLPVASIIAPSIPAYDSISIPASLATLPLSLIPEINWVTPSAKS